MAYNIAQGEGKVTSTPQTTHIVKDFYDAVAGGMGPYTSAVDKFSPSGPTDRVVEYARAAGAQRILDLGSGMGTTLLRLAHNHSTAAKYVGVDFSDKMVARARARVTELPPEMQRKIKFFNFDAQTIPFLDGDFDFIYSECVLNLLPSRSKTLAEIARLLAPNGVFVYTDFVSSTAVPSSVRENQGLVCGCRSGSMTLSENVASLEQYGFTAIECFNYTEDQRKRSEHLIASNPEIRREEETFQLEHPDMAAFLNNQVGYYLFFAIKA